MKKLMFSSAALVAVLVQPVAADQIKVGTKVGESAPSAGTYESLGHRDPFVSLIQPRRGTTPSVPRVGTGLGSFAVADVLVRGIVKKGDIWMAILESSDRQQYIAKVKDRLSDAVVKSIDRESVVFMESGDANYGRPKEVRKMLRTADEVKR
jgi:hypothetical protein